MQALSGLARRQARTHLPQAGAAENTNALLMLRCTIRRAEKVRCRKVHLIGERLLTGWGALNISAPPPAAGPEFARLRGLVTELLRDFLNVAIERLELLLQFVLAIGELLGISTRTIYRKLGENE